MKTEELSRIAKRAKEVGIAIYGSLGDKDFDYVSIDEDGYIYVHFSHYHYGDIDYESIFLSEEDMESPIEETVAKYKKIEQDKVEKEAKEKLEKEIAREKSDRETYERLKAKFEGS